ncbi:EAL domain-containing protein (putative c-di-GMP-specific phosphodiesterase class I) [Catenibacillus scindens]|uniref:EAL domain-containing protein (Putative c-di-GMP-specific phosphodiesterase class I) n=1 Tax=Catenibacillus scindens TaxID=673271 RepID=A0A7W8H765_9FIRM|nr:bifunctional diguanylate cyclase/phosphodiesterase [Catenibacillus scindens]MBB5262967.1 EAL domain-containing protein (putative c-di-GMP-specific phosphodiesterase class I) [Catenibacillus scindens]
MDHAAAAVNQAFREEHEMLALAMGKAPHILWEVDINSRIYSVYDIEKWACDETTEIKNFPKGFIDRGLVHPDSEEAFLKFGADLLSGSSGGSANFIMKEQEDGCYQWVSLTYRMILDSGGMPAKAVGIRENLPSVSGTIFSAFPRRPLPELVRHRLLLRISASLTEDVIENLWLEGANCSPWARGLSYSDMINHREKHLFARGETKAFEEDFQREALILRYKSGQRWFSKDYRRVDSGGNIRWMRGTVNLKEDKSTGQVYVFACFTDAQPIHEKENLLTENIEYDPNGGMYQYFTGVGMIKAWLATLDPDKTCALIAVTLIGGEAGEDRKSGDQRIYDWIGVALSLALGNDGIFVRYDVGKFLFFVEEDSKYKIRQHVEDGFAYVRNVLGDVRPVEQMRFVAGVVIRKVLEIQWDHLLEQADFLCHMWANAAMDSVVFAREDDLQIQGESRALSGTDKVLKCDTGVPGEPCADASGRTQKEPRAAKDGDFREEDEAKAAFDCVTAMITSKSLSDCARRLLEGIGDYYQADRAFMLTLSKDQREVSLRYEWDSHGKHSIRQSGAGISIDKFPTLLQCVETSEPATVSRPWGSADHTCQYSCFMICPLLSGRKTLGFVCVENAKVHAQSLHFVQQVSVPFLEIARHFWKTEKAGGSAIQDPLNNLPNLRDYENIAYAFNSDHYSTMGAVVLCVSDFSSLNATRGFSYGCDVLNCMLEELETVFEHKYVFRIWDAEFAALLPDTTQDVFNARCLRLRTRIARRYPGIIKMGSTWSDGIFNARALVREAKNLMKCDVALSPGMSASSVSLWSEKTFPVAVKQYIPYYQPKVDMRDGHLVGAEAVVRGLGENGRIIMPGEFVESLERDGGIRELDFFMLESVFCQLDQWRKKGLALPKISVNISRRTLFHPNTLASVLAIQSRYPDIPQGQVDLEITETAGTVETPTLSAVVERFREFNIEFELDDFGSSYANMSILSHIRFNTIKLDRSLVKDIVGNEISTMLVKNIADICRNFEMNCVAEGVENRQQIRTLVEAGCLYAQGYYYSKPVPAWKFEELYLSGQTTEKV